MKRIDFLKKKIKGYLKKEQLSNDNEHRKLEKQFLEKSRKNFTVSSLLFKISDEEELRKLLNLASDFEMYDWVIVIAYYAMYTSSLAALAKLGYRSKSHAATITILEYYYVDMKKVKESEKVEKKALEHKDLHKLVKAHSISEQLITKLLQTKARRESAQYDATPSITKEMAKASLDDADEFITKIEEILS
jgi:uncharacterized protein (UPF0332 family)